MFFNKRLALGLIGVMLAVGLVTIAVASTSNQQVSPQAQTAKIKSVTYIISQGSPQVVDISNPYIDVPYGYPIFFTVKGECTGPTSQKGLLYIYDYASGQYKNAVSITPGKLSKVTTNPPYFWHPTDIGIHTIQIGCFSPDGSHQTFFVLSVNVI